jgi:CheY-like chemotaxis protein
MLTLVNDLLAFSKMEVGKMEPGAAEFSLRVMLNQTLRGLALSAHEKGLGLSCQVDREVPDGLVGDSNPLRQVLLNLIGNAIKFTEFGEVVVRASEEPERSEGSAVLAFEITDTGIGIAPEAQQKIFKAFEPGDTSTTYPCGGTGLGLSIASRLVDMMGGRITLESAVGRGSTFRFTARFGRLTRTPEATVAPVADLHGLRGEGGTAPTISMGEDAPARRLRVLLAEDNEFNQQVMQHLLERRGHTVRTVRDGRETLAALDEASFDLLLLDVHMPEIGGFQVVRVVRAREREKPGSGHLPVIALTALSMKGDRERCLEAGMDDYLAKPVRATDLYATIARVLIQPVPARDPPSTTPFPSTAKDSPMLDKRTLLAACGGDPVLLTKMVQIFQAEAPLELAAVEAAIRQEEPARLSEAAHKMRGLVCVFSGATAAALRTLETLGAEGRCGDTGAALSTVSEAVAHLLAILPTLTIEQLRS